MALGHLVVKRRRNWVYINIFLEEGYSLPEPPTGAEPMQVYFNTQ